jgi:hypothetical protein
VALRRATTCLFVTVLGLAGAPAQAGAHSCAEQLTVAQGADTPVSVGVTVGDVPTGDVTFEFADSFEITGVTERRGWESELDGQIVRFTGGPLDAGVCDVFEVSVAASEPGTFRVRAFQRIEGGQVTEHPSEGDVFMNADGTSVVVNRSGPPDPMFEQVISVTEAGSDSSGPRTALIIVTAGALLAAAVAFLPRRKRPRTKLPPA